jgi:hypothetical protein
LRALKGRVDRTERAVADKHDGALGAAHERNDGGARSATRDTGERPRQGDTPSTMRPSAEKTPFRLLACALCCFPLACGGTQAEGDPAREPAPRNEDAELGADDDLPSSPQSSVATPSDTDEDAAEPGAGDDAADEAPAAPGGPSSAAEDIGMPAVLTAKGELVIPMRALDTAAVGILFAKGDDGTWTNPYGAHLDFALGDAYPDVVDVDVRDLILAELEEGIELRTTAVDGPGLDATVVDEDTFRVTLQQEGDFRIRLTGQHGGEPAGTFDTEVSVAVRTIGSLSLAGCGPDGGAALLGYEAAPGWLRVFAPDGTLIVPANADVARPVTVTVHASAETELRAADGLATLVAEGPPQVVEVTSDLGEVGKFELVEPSRVDGIDAWYYLSATWTRGLSLQSGMTQRVLFDSPGIISVEPRLTVEGRALCTPLAEEWFELLSRTPDVCPLAPSGEEFAQNARLVDGASVVAPGRCELGVMAPMFGSAGIATTLAVDFTD